MIDRFRRWAPIAVAIWVLTAFIAWHYESACGVFFSGVCVSQYWAGLRWILLLKWIAPYQTLLGGLAAVAAGTFVLLAAKLSSEQAQTAENARRKQSAIVACSIVADEFRDAQIQVSLQLSKTADTLCTVCYLHSHASFNRPYAWFDCLGTKA
ncbi:hypothetical protein ACS4RR_023710 [Rhizobium sp. Z1P35]